MRRWALRALLSAASVSLFVGVLRAVDLSRAAALIAASPGLWVVFAPAALATLADAEAWRRLLGASGGRVPYRTLVRTRLSAEAVAVTLPWGSVFGEGTALCLLRVRSGLAASRILGVVLSRRLYVTFAHGLVLAAASVVGFLFVGAGSPTSRYGITWVAPVAAAALVAFVLVVPRLVLRGLLAQRFPAFCRSLRESGTPGLAPLSPVTGLFVFMWLTESVESFIILRTLGAHLSFGQVFSLDVLVSLVRSLAVFAPAGLGFQDAGYMALLAGGRGAEAATLAAAFVLVKRAREMLFAAVGYVLLLLPNGSRRMALDGEPGLTAWGTL